MAPTFRSKSGGGIFDDGNGLEVTTLLSSGSLDSECASTPSAGHWTAASISTSPTKTSNAMYNTNDSRLLDDSFHRPANINPSSSFMNDDIVPLQTSVSKYKEEMRKRRMTNARPRSQLCRYTVDKVQGILLPQKISSYIPVSQKMDNNDNDNFDNMNRNINGSNGTGIDNMFRHPSRIPLVQGLERVTNGTQPASESVALCGMRPPRFLWFILSGCICDVIQFFIDAFLYYVFHITEPTVCWVLGYGLSIAVRHTSHRYLVFGNYVGGYCYSLLRMYTGYSISLVASTLFNLILTHGIEMQHYTAWVITLVWTNIVNYFLLTQLWSWDWSKGRKAFSLKLNLRGFTSTGGKKSHHRTSGGDDASNRLREVV
mmetsp:Transcript_8874/g.13247  ORF Transcript_8874/g.13247 Transcript_8874/m.13247 type:complete len:372 (+) Transcript_8874:375-1490(+)|eukprot:CAMPEP_0203664974 /NCGR_PEP_ID=MMETSP0090-20130426/2288_1 /ASSEMBLY_ACC=CAM_ASM_001088 /TAXON_ID=426623 /ORGANISM="Chaetoceros affinis, Strain CCMP159" /LENGTH=371 /DNA_ID=CAMNT_0050528403 /DNA_START=295 /DNA_END=1410 /DNA_ORIENTATION=+